MKFEVIRYEVFALEGGGEAMVVYLEKPPETTQSNLVGIKAEKKVTGVSGQLQLTLYDKPDQEKFKGLLGKTVQVGLEA